LPVNAAKMVVFCPAGSTPPVCGANVSKRMCVNFAAVAAGVN
jgi:hypothetical protein